jgi:hypothetical protein
MRRCNRRLETATFAQTVVIIQTMPVRERQDLEAIITRHLALGFTYSKHQIYRALDALTDPARPWDQRNRASARSRT